MAIFGFAEHGDSIKDSKNKQSSINQYPQELGNAQFPNMVKFFINQKKNL